VLPIVEIIPPDGCFFDFENKYNGMTKEICPADIDDTTKEILSSIALKSHAALMAQ
jgi:D-alanine-D-alanine ligase